MPFLGSQPVDQYKSLAKQTITGDGSTAYTLSRSVTNAYDMEVFINNVRQEPDTSYSASGNTITFTAAVTASDSCYLIYQGQSVGSINPPANSVGTSQVANNSITTAHMHTGFTLPAQTGALDITTSTHANASVFKSTGHTQIMLQDTNANANDQFWGLQNSGGSFNIVTCNDDRASGFVTPIEITQSAHVKMPNQPAWFYAGGTSLTTGSYVVTKPGTAYISSSHYSTSTGLFTAPVAGKYLVGVEGLVYPHSSNVMTNRWQKNGAQYGHVIQSGGENNSHTHLSWTQLVDLAQNDTIGFAINRSGSSENAYGSQWHQWGYLLG